MKLQGPPGKKHRHTAAERASRFKPGYEPGGVGELLEKILSAHQTMVLMKAFALQKKAKKYWAAYFKARSLVTYLSTEMLTKAKMEI